MSEYNLKNAFPSPPPSQQEVDEFRHAAGRGDKAAVTAFLDKYPAAVDHASIFGDTALTYAAQRGRKEIVELLLEKGAITDAPDSTGQTPFMWATENRHKDIAELLWEKTASAAAKDHRRALHAALKEKKSKTPSAGMVGDFVDAAGRGDVNAVTEFLDQYITAINQVDEDNYTALTMAAFNGQTAVVVLLLERGAQIDMRDSSGKTPLLCAAGMGHTGIVELLWKKGASLHVKNNRNETALMLAAVTGKTDTVQFFLEQGVPTDAVDEHGRTAQMMAKTNSRTETAELIEHWPEIRLQLEEKALELAKKQDEERARKEGEAKAEALNALRLEKLKGRRPPKPPLKWDRP
ncbi:MAG: ankyrin repeat domain-containing protein [Alphaproteobacteria bacterium]|nr:ankyrin repeat domain-containing protein [Alphaproteobacteria bacterium]